mgnify:CR=1 FL=1
MKWDYVIISMKQIGCPVHGWIDVILRQAFKIGNDHLFLFRVEYFYNYIVREILFQLFSM